MKRSEVIPAVIAAVTPVASPAVIIRNDFSEAKAAEMEAVLCTAGSGIVLAIQPITGASVSGKIRRGAFASQSSIALVFRMNPATKPNGFTADSLLDLVDAAAVALLSSQSIEADIDGQFIDLTAEDAGNLTYSLTVNIKTDTP